MEFVEWMQSNALFRGLSESELSAVEQISQRKIYQRGENVYKQGDESEAFFVVLQGKVEAQVVEGGGVRYTADAIDVGGTLGVLSFVSEEPRGATITVLENDTFLQMVPVARLLRLGKEQPELGFKFMTNLGYVLADKIHRRDYERADT